MQRAVLPKSRRMDEPDRDRRTVRFKTQQDYVRRPLCSRAVLWQSRPRPRQPGGPHDPHAFATVRTNFMIAGLEVVDCQPLSSQFKNGTDIKIACDIRDFLEHPTRFGEFIILSATPISRRCFITCAPMTGGLSSTLTRAQRTSTRRSAMAGSRRGTDLVPFDGTGPLMFLTRGPRSARRADGYDGPRTYSQSVAAQPALPALPPQSAPAPVPADFAPAPGYGVPRYSKRRLPPATRTSAVQSLIEDFQPIGARFCNLVIEVVRSSEKPVPIAYLADRAQKILGHAKTLGTNWAGSGGFLNFLNATLPDDIRLTDKPPHFVYDPKRHRLEERTEIPTVQAIPQKAQSPASSSARVEIVKTRRAAELDHPNL